MRRVIFAVSALLLAVQFLAVEALAQTTRKVAILETVDKENNIRYGVRLMIRGNLSQAITNTPGYEGYDRVDMDQILGEHDFQRTGNVSDEQIKKLGEMTGAAYILVAEAAMVDESNVFIMAKILNVESARIEKVSNVQSGIDAEELQESCVQLAESLFGLKSISNKTAQAAPAPAPARQQTPQMSNEEIARKAVENTRGSWLLGRKRKEQIIQQAVQTGNEVAQMIEQQAIQQASAPAPAPQPQQQYVPYSSHNRAPLRPDQTVILGIDLSQVRVYGAKESPEEFRKAFQGMNKLLVEEENRYSFRKSLGIKEHPIIDIDMMLAHNDNRDWATLKTSYAMVPQIDVFSLVRSYQLRDTQGMALVVVGKLFDKKRGKATYQVLLFDIATRNIVHGEELETDAGGAGLRNYWAGSVKVLTDKFRIRK